MPVTLHVREKKKWRKYPCTVKNAHFIQYKDTKVLYYHDLNTSLSLQTLYYISWGRIMRRMCIYGVF